MNLKPYALQFHASPSSFISSVQPLSEDDHASVNMILGLAMDLEYSALKKLGQDKRDGYWMMVTVKDREGRVIFLATLYKGFFNGAFGPLYESPASPKFLSLFTDPATNLNLSRPEAQQKFESHILEEIVEKLFEKFPPDSKSGKVEDWIMGARVISGQGWVTTSLAEMIRLRTNGILNNEDEKKGSDNMIKTKRDVRYKSPKELEVHSCRATLETVPPISNDSLPEGHKILTLQQFLSTNDGDDGHPALGQVVNLVTEFFEATHEAGGPWTYERCLPMVREKQTLVEKLSWVYVVPSPKPSSSITTQAVGFTFLGRLTGNTVALRNLYVEPTFRRKGIGEALVKFVCHEWLSTQAHSMASSSVPPFSTTSLNNNNEKEIELEKLEEVRSLKKKQVTLIVNDFNDGGKRMYERSGFRWDEEKMVVGRWWEGVPFPQM